MFVGRWWLNEHKKEGETIGVRGLFFHMKTILANLSIRKPTWLEILNASSVYRVYWIDFVNYHHSVFTGSQIFHSHFFHRLLIVCKEYYWKLTTYSTYSHIWGQGGIYERGIYWKSPKGYIWKCSEEGKRIGMIWLHCSWPLWLLKSPLFCRIPWTLRDVWFGPLHLLPSIA